MRRSEGAARVRSGIDPWSDLERSERMLFVA